MAKAGRNTLFVTAVGMLCISHSAIGDGGLLDHFTLWLAHYFGGRDTQVPGEALEREKGGVRSRAGPG